MPRGLWVYLAAAVLAVQGLAAADLTLSYNQPAVAAIDWDGVNDIDGDGSINFTNLGESQTATLSVLCNSITGYRVTFNTPNATGATSSLLVNGSHDIPYTAVLDTSGVQNANVTASSLVLNNAGQHSVDVNFTGGILPLDGTNPANVNRIELDITLADFDGSMKPQGVYQDVITATITLN